MRRVLFQSVSRWAIRPRMASGAALSAELTVEQVDEAEALKLLLQAKSASWRQFPAYSAVAAAEAGAQSGYLLVSDRGKRLALASIRIKRIPLLPAGLAMIAQGPVMLTEEKGLLARVHDSLAQHVSGTLGLTLQINPPVVPRGERSEPGSAFLPVPQSNYETFLIDLAPDLEMLRANLNGKWRTDLRRGEKSGVAITRSSCEEDFLAFQPLLDQLAKGKGFAVPQDARFFARVAEQAHEGERIEIHLARREGRVIGGHVGAFSGDMAVYLIGATDVEGRALRASYLLQWAVIEHARQLGMGWYDLGGVDEADNPHVFRFKKRMGGHHYLGPPKIEVRAAWPRGQIVRLAEWAYSRAKG